MRAWNIKGLDTAGAAKQMLCLMGVEAVGIELILAREQSKTRFRNNQVQIGAARTYRTVTLRHGQVSGSIHFETYSATMAAAGMGDELSHAASGVITSIDFRTGADGLSPHNDIQMSFSGATMKIG